MSIKGIDTQIMISRLPDNARDTSIIQKRPEVVQEFLAAQTKISHAQDQSRVVRTTEAEMEQIRTDVEEGGGSGAGGGGAGSENRDNEEIDPDLLVPPGDNKIDIRV